MPAVRKAVKKKPAKDPLKAYSTLATAQLSTMTITQLAAAIKET